MYLSFRLAALAFFIFVAQASMAQKGAINTTKTTRIEPPNWFITAKDRSLQLLVHHPEIATAKATVSYPGLRITKQYRLESTNYLVLLLSLDKAVKSGEAKLTFNWADGKNLSLSYQLLDKPATQQQPITAADAVYLITPDRFANGNPANDDAVGFSEKSDRSKNYARHGGDIKGITDRLPYLQDLGITTVWINPVLTNNMPHSSYHGYAITDFYEIDPRFGTLAEYKNLISTAHGRGMKVVKDMVLNHAGSFNHIFVDPPSKKWFNHYGEPGFRSNFRASVVPDPHASAEDTEVMTDGWFDSTMPDLNQRDSTLARYLIQNSLWWVFTAGIDGIRMDTYPYPEKNFMLNWVKALREQFPTLYIVGEVWVSSPALAAYWTTKGKGVNTDKYAGNLPTITDFPLFSATNQAFNQNGGWDDGLNKIYNLLSQDFVYDDASQHLVFLDNHDVNRFCSEVGMDTAKMKMALTFLSTVRGVPQIYYGTEIMLKGKDGSHPELRQDFPGGWAGDVTNSFDPKNHTPAQKAVYQHMRKLLTWRKSSPAIAKGNYIHYVGDGNLYVYGRKHQDASVMVILNNNGKEITHELGRYQQLIKGYSKAKNVITGEVLTDLKSVTVAAKSGLLLELIK